MEYGTLEREIFVQASPEIVFDVVSRPEHLKEWWPDDARYEPVPGAAGHIVFRREGEDKVQTFEVIDVEPPTSFSFRWTQPAGEPARPGNSLLVTFELTAAGGGTRLRMTESGFREMGWEAAVLEEAYHDHVTGWDFFLPRIAPYVATLAARP